MSLAECVILRLREEEEEIPRRSVLSVVASGARRRRRVSEARVEEEEEEGEGGRGGSDEITGGSRSSSSSPSDDDEDDEEDEPDETIVTPPTASSSDPVKSTVSTLTRGGTGGGGGASFSPSPPSPRVAWRSFPFLDATLGVEAPDEPGVLRPLSLPSSPPAQPLCFRSAYPRFEGPRWKCVGGWMTGAAPGSGRSSREAREVEEGPDEGGAEREKGCGRGLEDDEDGEEVLVVVEAEAEEWRMNQ